MTDETPESPENLPPKSEKSKFVFGTNNLGKNAGPTKRIDIQGLKEAAEQGAIKIEPPKPLVEPFIKIPHATERTLENAVNNFKTDVKRIFKEGKNQYANVIDHGDHLHGSYDVKTVEKLGFAAGAVASLGVAIHGLVNIKRGLTGFEDKDLDIKKAPSLQYTMVGAAETVGGLALAKRLLTGTFRIF